MIFCASARINPLDILKNDTWLYSFWCSWLYKHLANFIEFYFKPGSGYKVRRIIFPKFFSLVLLVKSLYNHYHCPNKEFLIKDCNPDVESLTQFFHGSQINVYSFIPICVGIKMFVILKRYISIYIHICIV